MISSENQQEKLSVKTTKTQRERETQNEQGDLFIDDKEIQRTVCFTSEDWTKPYWKS